jgi:plastocyanin
MPARPRSRRRQLLLPAALVVSWLVLNGGGSMAAVERPQAAASCSPSGNQLQITAFDQKFNKDCLAAPAGQNFTVEFNNLDRGIPHNLAIYADETAAKTYFKGELVDGPGKMTYSVPGVPAGTWFFRCDPHPDMKGTFVSG